MADLRAYARGAWLAPAVALPSALLFHSILFNLWPWTTTGWPLAGIVWGPGLWTVLAAVPVSLVHTFLMRLVPTKSHSFVMFWSALLSASLGAAGGIMVFGASRYFWAFQGISGSVGLAVYGAKAGSDRWRSLEAER